MKLIRITIVIISIYFLFSCNSKSKKNIEESNKTERISTNNSEDKKSSIYENNSFQTTEENEINPSNSYDCKFEDGTYSATVDYNNSETGYSTTYSLEVEVQDCQIIQIYFPNGGYLDEDHISFAEIDEEGSAVVEGENGKSYEIQLDI